MHHMHIQNTSLSTAQPKHQMFHSHGLVDGDREDHSQGPQSPHGVAPENNKTSYPSRHAGGLAVVVKTVLDPRLFGRSIHHPF